MNKRTLMYIAGGLVLLYLFTRKAPAQMNSDMGGPNFGVIDPSTWG